MFCRPVELYYCITETPQKINGRKYCTFLEGRVQPTSPALKYVAGRQDKCATQESS